jgi:hypothetical protein
MRRFSWLALGLTALAACTERQLELGESDSPGGSMPGNPSSGSPTCHASPPLTSMSRRWGEVDLLVRRAGTGGQMALSTLVFADFFDVGLAAPPQCTDRVQVGLCTFANCPAGFGPPPGVPLDVGPIQIDAPGLPEPTETIDFGSNGYPSRTAELPLFTSRSLSIVGALGVGTQPGFSSQIAGPDLPGDLTPPDSITRAAGVRLTWTPPPDAIGFLDVGLVVPTEPNLSVACQAPLRDGMVDVPASLLDRLSARTALLAIDSSCNTDAMAGDVSVTVRARYESTAGTPVNLR